MSTSTYTVSSLVGCQQIVQATCIALLFTYGINFFCQMIIVCCAYNENPKGKALAKQKILDSSRVLYWSAIANMFSMYPPFYYGVHSAILSWITLGSVLLMHIFCFIDVECGRRSLWSYFYFFYHFFIGVWILVALIIAYIWSGYQNPSMRSCHDDIN